MEKNEKKTQKAIYVKYMFIGLGIVCVIVAVKLLTSLVYKINHPTPDITVVIASDKVMDFDAEDTLEAYLSGFVPDIDGNGKTVVNVVGLRLIDNEAITDNELEIAGAETDIDLLREYFENGVYAFYMMANTRYDTPVTNYCNGRYCRELPENLQNSSNPYGVNLTGAPLFSAVGWEYVEFYACIHKEASDREYEAATAILSALKEELPASESDQEAFSFDTDCIKIYSAAEDFKHPLVITEPETIAEITQSIDLSRWEAVSGESELSAVPEYYIDFCNHTVISMLSDVGYGSIGRYLHRTYDENRNLLSAGITNEQKSLSDADELTEYYFHDGLFDEIKKILDADSEDASIDISADDFGLSLRMQ